MKSFIYRFLLLTGLFPSPAIQAEEVPTLNPVVVTASRLPSLLSETTSNTTIITRARIRELNPETVAELLQTVAGIHVSRVGGVGGLSQVFIRGADPNFTMFLIDGIQVNNPMDTRGGTFDISAMNPLSIERIEIVRGPLSSVYGSEALGGVVNIITRGATRPQGAPEATRTAFSGSTGTGGQRKLGATLRTNITGGIAVALTAGHLDVGNRVSGTRRKISDATANARLKLSDDMELSITGRFSTSDSHRFPDDSGGPVLAVRRTTETANAEDILVGAEVSKSITDEWSAVFKASIFRNNSQTTSPGVAPGTRDPFGIPASFSNDSYERFNIGQYNRFYPHEDIELTLGADLRTERGDSNGFLVISGSNVPTGFSLDRRTVSAYVEARYSGIPDLTLDAALRSDWPENIDRELSPRVGLAWNPTGTGTTIRASWSQGFKLPSFFALANPIVGNAALRPETSRSVDFGIEQVILNKTARIGISVFRSDFFNLVDFDPGPPPRLVNRSNVRSEGIEIDADLSLTKDIDFSLFAAYAKTQNRADGASLRNRPKWRGGGNLKWRPTSAISVNWNLQYTGSSLDSSVPTGARRLDEYLLANVSASWKPADRWMVRATIENLFDISYEETIGSPGAGVTGRLGAELAF